MASERSSAVQRRGRLAVSLAFLLYGTILGAWTVRIPAIKQGLGLGDGALSVGLLAFAAGAIAGMQASGRLVDTRSSATIMIPAVFADGLALVLPAHAPNLAGLVVALFVFGAVHGTLNVAMNVNAVEVQRAYGRPVITSFHAVYSVGGFLGAAFGGLFAYAGAGPAATFAAVAASVLVLGVAVARWALRATPAAAEPTATGHTRGVLFLGVLVFCCLVGEGAAADWSAVYLRDTLGSSAGFAASAYAGFSIMMTAGRLVGDRMAVRFGAVRLVRASGILAGAGLAVALLSHHPVAGVLGFGCLGAGLSCIAPQVFSAAGNRDPARAGQAIARVAGLGFLGFVVGPVVIGGAAALVGLAAALAIPAVLALFVAGTAPALRTGGTAPA